MRKRFTVELFTVWFFAALSLVGFIYVMTTYPRTEKGYPGLVFGLMFLFSVLCLLKQYKSEKEQASTEERTENPYVLKTAVVIVVTIGYMLLMDKIGFLIGTILYTCLLPIYLGYRRLLPIILTSACCIAFVYFLFSRLYIPIPVGFLGV